MGLNLVSNHFIEDIICSGRGVSNKKFKTHCFNKVERMVRMQGDWMNGWNLTLQVHRMKTHCSGSPAVDPPSIIWVLSLQSYTTSVYVPFNYLKQILAINK